MNCPLFDELTQRCLARTGICTPGDEACEAAIRAHCIGVCDVLREMMERCRRDRDRLLLDTRSEAARRKAAQSDHARTEAVKAKSGT